MPVIPGRFPGETRRIVVAKRATSSGIGPFSVNPHIKGRGVHSGSVNLGIEIIRYGKRPDCWTEGTSDF